MSEDGLKAEMGLWSTTMLIIGSMIGSGIFFVPATMYVSTGSAPVVMAAFLIGGLLSLAGALVLSELAAAYPRAGGQAVYIREAFGKLPAFLFTWASFIGVQSGAIAAIAIAFAATLDTFVTLPGTRVAWGILTIPKWGTAFVAVAAILVLSIVNYLGIRRAARLNDAATVAKLGGLAFVVIAAFALGRGADNFSGSWFGGLDMSAAGLAIAAGLFAYDGWAQPTFIASEVKDAPRNVPRALLLGVSIVTAIYMLVSWAYFHVVPGGMLTADTAIAQETALLAVGAVAATIMGVAILVSTFGATHAYVLTSPRIYYDEAREGGFPSAFGELNRHRVPGWGVIYQFIVASFLALTGTFDQLLALVVGVVYAFYMVTAIGHLKLRRAHPERFQRFRMPLWPLPYIVFVVVGFAVLLNLLISDLRTTIMGGGLLLLGVPVYFAMRRSNGSPTRAVK